MSVISLSLFCLSNMSLCLRNYFIVFIFHVSYLTEDRAPMELLFVSLHFAKVSLHRKSSSAFFIVETESFLS